MHLLLAISSLAIFATAQENLITESHHHFIENFFHWSREQVGEGRIPWSEKAEEIALEVVKENCNPRSILGLLMDKKTGGYHFPAEYYIGGQKYYNKQTKSCSEETCVNFMKVINPRNAKFGCAILFCPTYPTKTFTCAFLDSNDKLVYTGASLDDQTPPADLPSPVAPTLSAEPAGTIGSKVTAAEKKSLVDLHNKVRNEASSSIPKLEWSSELAASAQAHISKCEFKHSDTKYGENLALGSTGFTLVELANLWVKERDDYDYSTNTCKRVCGHYTQMVWKNTMKIGCGVAQCNGNTMLCCQYDPAGNYVGQKPY